VHLHRGMGRIAGLTLSKIMCVSIDADVDPEGDDHFPQGSSRPAGLGKAKSTWVSSRPHLLQEIDAVTDAYANTDEAWTKTFSRIVVERYLQHVSHSFVAIYSCQAAEDQHG
jgi:hypothetical protein